MCQSIWYLKKFWFRREVLAGVRPFIFIGSPESRQYPSLYLTTSSISLPNWRPPNPPVDNKQQPQIPPKHRLNLKKMTNRAEMIFTKFEMRCDAKQPKDCKPNNHFKPLFPTFHWWPNLAAFPSSRGSAVCELCEKTFATHRKEWREIIYIE